MRTPLAILNLFHQRRRAIVSIGGVTFALLLVFMQLGFMGAVSHTATNLLEHLEFDAILRAPDYVHLYEAGTIDVFWLDAARNAPGVSSATPLWIVAHNWRKMPTEAELSNGTYEPEFQPIAIIGMDAMMPLPLQLDEVQSQRQILRIADAMLVDVSTHAEYGPWNGRQFSQADVAMRRRTEVGSHEYRIAGLFRLGTGLAANGLVIMGRDAIKRIWPWPIESTCTLGLLTFDKQSSLTDEQIVALVRERLTGRKEDTADDAKSTYGPVEVLSRQEMINAEKDRWLWDTPIGLIFQLGVALSMVVGAAIVYMVLATDVTNRLPEYATMLAMGYSRIYLCQVVLTQAFILAASGFAVSWVTAEGMYRLVTRFSGIPLEMTWQRLGLVAGLGVLMCSFSGVLALRKLWQAEPASLF